MFVSEYTIEILGAGKEPSMFFKTSSLHSHLNASNTKFRISHTLVYDLKKKKNKTRIIKFSSADIFNSPHAPLVKLFCSVLLIIGCMLLSHDFFLGGGGGEVILSVYET